MNIFQEILNKMFIQKNEVLVKDIPKDNLTLEQAQYLRAFGTTLSGIQEIIDKQVMVSYDRYSLYMEEEKALSHPLMSAAIDLYASTAVPLDTTNNASVYILSENKTYKATLDALLERIGIEEHVYDWAYNICAFGDLFVGINAQPNVGILSLDDSKAPIEFFRVENQGQLIGFVKNNMMSANVKEGDTFMSTPWSYVHFRLHGARKRRASFGSQVGGYRSTLLGVGGNTLQDSTSYGSSILVPALPVYKRLRLAEDAILMARATRGVIKYAYLVGIDPKNSNMEGVQSLLQTYRDTLKRARALDTTDGAESYSDRVNNIAATEDIIIPVWGDVNSFRIEKMGGEVDIKWLTDIEELRNQLATALSVPLTLLGGFQSESGPGLQSSLERTDIRFARSVSKVQRSVLNGIKRICQIHLAYLGMDPDPKLFDVQLGGISSAAEEEGKEILIKSAEAADKLTDLLIKFTGEDNINRGKIFDLVNDKILKLKDIQYSDIVTKVPGLEGGPVPTHMAETRSMDFNAPLPLKETGCTTNPLWENVKETKVSLKLTGG